MKGKKILLMVELGFLINLFILWVKIIKCPLLLVKVISVKEVSEFDKKPNSEMGIKIRNTIFSYKLPVLLNKKELKELNEKIKICNSGIIKVIEICRWVRKKIYFRDDGIHYYFWTPQRVLQDSEKNGFLCDSYARLSACIAQTFEIPSRVIWLGGHVVPEFYLSDLKKWVMIDPAYGCYLKSGNVILSTTQIISSFEKNKMPEIVYFGDMVKDDEPVPTLKSLIPVYTNKFTFCFNGENTQKGIRYTLFHELKFPRGLQYIEEDTPPHLNMERNGEMVRILIIINFLGFILCSTFLIKK